MKILFTMPAPDGDAQGFAQQLRQLFAVPITVRGRLVQIVFSGVADLRMRSTTAVVFEGVQTHTPHDCHLTIGECRTTRKTGKSDPEHLIITTTESGGIWKSIDRFDPERDPAGRSHILFERVLTVDRRGFWIDANETGFDAEGNVIMEIRTRRVY